MSSNSHAGLSFNVAGLRRGTYAPPRGPDKPAPSLPQHTSPYQNHPTFQAQQPQQSPYSHHLFAPTPPPISNVTSVQNAARAPPPQMPQMPPTLPGPRRAPAPRQKQQQPTASLGYLQQSLNQPPLGQQSMGQSMGQQSMTQQSITQQSMASQPMPSQSLNPQPMNPQQLSQPSLGQQSLGQQSLSQQSMPQQSMPQQAMSQQAINQPVQSIPPSQQQNGSPMLSQQSTPRPPPQPTLPPAQPQMSHVQPAQKAQQVPVPQQAPQQVQQVQQVQQPAPPVQQQTAPRQSEPAAPSQQGHQNEMMVLDLRNQGESSEGDSSVEPKLVEGSPFVPREPMGPMMSAPPEGGSFPTLEAIHKHVLTYCTSVGYAVVIGRSKKTVPGLKKVLFVCDRAGKPPKRVSPEMRKRKTTSRKCDCPFGFFAIEQRTQWTVRYRPDASHLQHNHGPSESPLLHPAARKLDSKMVAAVKQLKENGVGVSQTLEILQQDNPHVPLLPRDIYNARAAINRNPQKVASALAENRPAIYSKPHPSAEERIRADLRRELAKAREELEKLKADSSKEIEELKAKIQEKDKVIERFEQFIDICNQRVIVSLSSKEDRASNGTSAS
ncbi:hypothetical protein VTK26DRAFT_4272 [Humicola hyalothermophila]